MLGFSNYILLINKQALSRGGERETGMNGYFSKTSIHQCNTQSATN